MQNSQQSYLTRRKFYWQLAFLCAFYVSLLPPVAMLMHNTMLFYPDRTDSAERSKMGHAVNEADMPVVTAAMRKFHHRIFGGTS